ncbi:MarR family winged helix-turn-helix transcriptional regulator [Lapidilactobacillus wuchangensis]|uniref:MarR family winged helix-turn-helix transcriptional regulator n=1 Tax=Lapidilactobacillus wuchangensis TaxID=2486001 RepID=UPI000F7B6E03|nr:hypothetical protein [Lapidilactobacillus wuchangensis]
MLNFTEVTLEFIKQLRLIEQQLSLQNQLPISQMRLLLKMDQEFVNLRFLNQELALDPSTLSRQLAGLTKKGYTQTATKADKRQRDYALTAAGWAKHQELIQQLAKLEQELVANWAPEEVQLLTTLLNRLTKSTHRLDLSAENPL